ncbi:MAG TPA: hypothetical protein VIL85_15025 [Thermomicrobiales bacterium]
MTQRKCGTCRFYEVGAQHGWCRNPASPRCDDVALLRPDELGCRVGWGKDYWAVAPGVIGGSGPVAFDPDAQPTHPIPTIASSPAANLATVAATLTPNAVAKGRRGIHGPAIAPSGGTMPSVSAAKDDGVKRDTTLEGHPELNEQGIPYRNSSKRSPVAEAHRRALERREKERLAKEAHERELAKARENAAPIPVVSSVAPEPSASRPPLIGPLPEVHLRPMPIKPEGEKFALTSLSDMRVRHEPRPAMMPKPPLPVAEEPDPVVIPVAEDAVDRVIQNVEPILPDTARESNAPIPSAPETSAPAQAAPRELPTQNTAVEKRPNRIPLPSNDGLPTRLATGAPVAGPEPAEPGKPTRYWHEPSPSGRYQRMDLPPVPEGELPLESRVEQRHVQSIARPQPQPPVSTERSGGRRGIRTLEEAKHGIEPALSAPPVEAPPIEPPRIPIEKRPVVTAPPVPEVAPREIDEALLRQLETNWRTQELAAHVGQRCGNCRFFRPTPGGQGTCGCSFSNAYEQQTGPQDLSCLDGIGTWWAATDEGWLERTERRPRRATPLLDSLLREREEELARSMPERRRSAR